MYKRDGVRIRDKGAQVSYLGRPPKDWNFFLFIMKTDTDICQFIFCTHDECVLKYGLYSLSVH
jgi:hypothetical protein